jgi:GH18 family chitinase
MNSLYNKLAVAILAPALLLSSCSLVTNEAVPVGVTPTSDRKIVTYYPSYVKYDSANGLTASDFLAKSDAKSDYATDEFVPSFIIIGDGQTVIGNEKLAWKLNQFAFDDMYAWAGLEWSQDPVTAQYDGTVKYSNGVDAGTTSIAAALKQYPTRPFGLAIGGWPKDSDPADPQRTGAFNRLGASPTDMDAAMATIDNSLYAIGKLSRVPSGYHVDFEFPLTATQGQNLLKFCQALKAKDATKKISIAVGPNVTTHLSVLPWAQLNTVVDNFEIMTYDFTGAFSGQTTAHHTAVQNSIPASLQNSTTYSPDFNINSCVTYVLGQGIPAKKILIGVALYGRFWTGVNFPASLTENSPYYSTAVQATGDVTATMIAAGFDAGSHTIKYNRLNALIAAAPSEWVKHYDATAKAAYIVNTAKKIFISYDNESSVADKAAYVKTKGLGGVIIWDASGAKGTTILKYLRTQLDNPM